jgi:DNA invertase Pin-like site-specific DNA recombinase
MATDLDNAPAIRAGCYCRISSDPNDRREGVARQRDDTSALCEIKGWQIADFYVDNDRSASSGKERPEWERLLADIEAGKIDAIAAWDQDRSWRMMSELEDLRRFFTGLGRRVPLATTGQGDIDLYSPTGILAAQIKTAVSEHEISMMRVRQRRAARAKAEKGKPQWRRAFGYLDTPAGPVPDPEIAPLVRDGYAAILAGASLKDVAKMWNDAGALTQKWNRRRDDDGEVVLDPATGKPQMVCTRGRWNESIVSEFLRKPRNAGLREHITTGPDGRQRSEIVGLGTWEPLVEEPLWRAVQANMAARGGPRRGQRRSVRRHLLTGILLCGKCGHTLGGSWVMQKTGGKSGRPKAGQHKEPHPGTLSHLIAYTCKGCHGVSIRAAHVEPWLIELIGRRLAREDAVNLLKKEIHDEAEAQALRDDKAILYGELTNLAVERANGLLTGAQVKIASEIVQQKIDAIERKEEDAERVRVFDGIPLGTPEAGAAVEALTPDRLRAVMRVLMDVKIEPTGKGGYTFHKKRVKVKWKS